MLNITIISESIILDKIKQIGKSIPIPLIVGRCDRADLFEAIDIGK